MSSTTVTERDKGAAVQHLGPIERAHTLGDQVHAQLSELLVSGQVAPGDQLSLRRVAANLGVSMMPVREAVTRLTAEGALEVMPNRAVRVPPMSAERFRDLTRVRVSIEGFAAAEAARQRTSANLDAIHRAEDAFRIEVQQSEPDPVKVIALNKDLHFAIYQAADSPILMEIVRGLWLKAGPIINLDFRDSRERLARGGALERHRRIVDAVVSQQEAEAREAVVDDIQSAADYILSQSAARGS